MSTLNLGLFPTDLHPKMTVTQLSDIMRAKGFHFLMAPLLLSDKVQVTLDVFEPEMLFLDNAGLLHL